MPNVRVVGRRALIGFSGFVGSTLDKPGRFTDRYNSKNIDTIQGDFDLIVCAGAPGTKWKANQRPEHDELSIHRLTDNLGHVTTKRFILISTIDAPRDHAYGRNRKFLEDFVLAEFPGAAVIRLPALFGPGLRKNALYDLLTGRPTNGGMFHWYAMQDLWGDIMSSGPGISTLLSEAVSMQEIADRFFGGVALVAGSPDYNYNEAGPFIMSKEEALERIGIFVKEEWKCRTSSKPAEKS